MVPDVYREEYGMVEHLIEDHGCRKLNYVGGMKDHPDNILRKKAYKDALSAHGIPIEEMRIRDYSFLDTDGQQAYQDFKELGIELPDAVVCANDSMALGYCYAAEKDGKYPPEDFLIIGYDNDENSKAFTPMITTVDKNSYEMGYLGCDVLLQLISGEQVEQKITYGQKAMLRGSCGCYAKEEQVQWDTRQLQRQIYNRVKEETIHFERLIAVRENLGLSDSEEMFHESLSEVMRSFHIYGYCVCINQNIYYGSQAAEINWETGFDELQYVLSGMRQGESQTRRKIIKSKDLIPDYLKQEDDLVHDYIFVPLHKNGAGLGYFVMADAAGVLLRRMILHIVNAIDNAYSNLRNLNNLKKMNKRLDSVYLKDALTDMYNRFGYMRDGYAMFEKSKAYGKPLLVMFMDLDRLKEINDVYGHSHGDNALILFSDVLKSVVEEDMIAVRYGGDEFLIIGQVADCEEAEGFKRELIDALEAANARAKLPYRIEASIGYVLTEGNSDKELDDYVQEADALMYEVKKRNRKNRKS